MSQLARYEEEKCSVSVRVWLTLFVTLTKGSILCQPLMKAVHRRKSIGARRYEISFQVFNSIYSISHDTQHIPWYTAYLTSKRSDVRFCLFYKLTLPVQFRDLLQPLFQTLYSTYTNWYFTKLITFLTLAYSFYTGFLGDHLKSNACTKSCFMN